LPIKPYFYGTDGNTQITMDDYDDPLRAYDARAALAELERKAEEFPDYWRLRFAVRAPEGVILAHLASGRSDTLIVIPFGY
jgi:hypothetical protein